MNNRSYFLITGMARSGTTLLDKLLYNHQQLDVLSQPMPILYRFFKEKFFQHKNIHADYYVLNNLFLETRYKPNDLNTFLEQYVVSYKQLQNLLEEMGEWSGQYTEIEDVHELLEHFQDTNLAGIYKYMVNRLRQKAGVSVIGSKEILVEEFSEYFLNNNIKIIYLIRDPRDVYTSLNYGLGKNYGGKHRPTLFHIRNWRKSIASYLRNASNPNALLVRYEDLVSSSIETLNSIADFLNVDSFGEELFAEGIKSQDGTIWEGNSSTTNFEKPISGASVASYKKHLDPETIKYIEYTCWPELKYLEYVPTALENPAHYSPESFQEPFDIEVDDLDSSLSTQSEIINNEKKRLGAVMGEFNLTPEEQRLYFLGKDVFKQLKRNQK